MAHSVGVSHLKLLHNCRKTKLKVCERLDTLIDFETQFLHYLNLYYIILELKLKGIYKYWSEEFILSIPYKFYMKYKLVIIQAKRWVKTLRATIFFI